MPIWAARLGQLIRYSNFKSVENPAFIRKDRSRNIFFQAGLYLLFVPTEIQKFFNWWEEIQTKTQHLLQSKTLHIVQVVPNWLWSDHRWINNIPHFACLTHTWIHASSWRRNLSFLCRLFVKEMGAKSSISTASRMVFIWSKSLFIWCSATTSVSIIDNTFFYNVSVQIEPGPVWPDRVFPGRLKACGMGR